MQCLGSVSIVWLSSIVLGIHISYQILIATYLIFYPIYTFDRLVGISIDRITNPERSDYVAQIRGILKSILPVVIILAIVTLLIWSQTVWGVIMGILIIIFGLLYPLYFKNLSKKIIGFKNYYVALVFTLLITFPYAFYGMQFPKGSVPLLLMLLVFFRALIMQLVLDIKDISGDRLNRLKTFPVIFGKGESIIISLIGLLIFEILLPVIFISVLKLLPPFVYGYVFSSLLTIFSLVAIKKNRYSGYLLESFSLFTMTLIIYICSLSF